MTIQEMRDERPYVSSFDVYRVRKPVDLNNPVTQFIREMYSRGLNVYSTFRAVEGPRNG